MPLIKPFTALRPSSESAGQVLAPPYDVLNTEEARRQAEGNPLSFLHVSKPEIDLPPTTDSHADAVYERGAANLRGLIDSSALRRDSEPHYYIYRLTMDSHVQTGIVVAASVDAYNANTIRKHEFTRPVKENDRVRHMEALNAQTGPVFVVHRSDEELAASIAAQSAGEPEIDVVGAGSVRHQLWVVRDAAALTAISAAVERLGMLYIADGHHRSAAASRVAAARDADDPAQYFLAVIFPHDEVQILDYNRVIKDLAGMTPTALVTAIKETGCAVAATDAAYKPTKAAEFGLYVDGGWYSIEVPANLIPSDPVGRLDVSLLHGLIIEPLLGVSDPRTDERIDFVGGIRGMAELEKRVDSGEMAVAFSLFATSLEALMAVADAGEVMPPKSTWFEPKLADGMVCHVLDHG